MCELINALIWLLPVCYAGIHDAGIDSFLIDREVEVFDHFHEYTLRNFNQTCNNLQASVECADACDNALWHCIEACMELGEVDDTTCLHTCGRDEYGCVDSKNILVV